MLGWIARFLVFRVVGARVAAVLAIIEAIWLWRRGESQRRQARRVR